MKKNIYPIFVQLVIISLFFILSCPNTQYKVCVVTFVKGNAFLIDDEDSLTKIMVGDKLKLNSTIKTGSNSLAEIKIGYKSIVRLKENSIMKLTELPNNLPYKNTKILLKTGKLFANPEKIHEGSSFEIETDSITVGVRGTKFSVGSNKNGVSKVVVSEGEVRVSKKITISRWSIDTINQYAPEIAEEINSIVQKDLILETNDEIEVSHKKIIDVEKRINKIAQKLSSITPKNKNKVLQEIKQKDIKDIKKILNELSTTTQIFILVKKGILYATGVRNKKKNKIKKIKVNTFYISKYEVTFVEYDEYCDAIGAKKPSDEGWGREKRPVINVSWYDAVNYCNWKSKNDGLTPCYSINKKKKGKSNKYDSINWTVKLNKNATGYRLPTNAEWEFAARGGNENSKPTEYSGGNSIDSVSWYYFNSNRRTHPVGVRKPNKLGIYDMSGNVWEWVYNRTDKYAIIRGGSWNYEAKYSRINHKYLSNPSRKDYDVGFRIVKEY